MLPLMHFKLIKYLCALFFLLFSITSQANLVIHYMPTEDPNDHRLTYILDLLQLALSKNAPPDEVIQFKSLPTSLSYARAIHEMKRNTYENYFTPGGVNIEQLGTGNLIAVDFPIDHGLLSYRICFVSPKSRDKVSKVNSIEELRRFTIAQGTNWSDVSILKNNGFTVIEVPVFTSLFKMVMSNRIDLVCRGINELRKELEAFGSYGNLLYDQSFVLIYTMPYQLYFNQASAELVARIEAGIMQAQKDGSLQQLFNGHFGEDIKFAELDKRRRFYLKTGYEDSFSETYRRYLYNPFQNQ
jgi:hypothetical protein